MDARPNIILIMTDQQRFDTIGAWGNKHMVTPHMDRIARNGISFHNAFCPGATCVASRAAMFTGMYAHNTGAHSFFNWGHHRTWVQDLADGGYYCASIGKMHFQPRDVPGGFHDRIIVENPTSVTNWGGNGDDDWGNYLHHHGEARPNHRHRSDPAWKRKFQCVPWHLDEHLHSDVYTGDAAAGWVRHYEEDKPLFLQVGFPGPHEPWDPLPRHLHLYRDKSFPKPHFREGDLEGKPPQHEAHQQFHASVDHESCIDMPKVTDEDIEKIQRHYYAKISLVDEQVGKLLDALEGEGLLENSFVVFCSDHGDMLCDHRLIYKWLMYDTVTRVPLMISGPGIGKMGQVEDLVSLMDVGPTLLELAGINPPTRLEGRSLSPYLKGGSIEPRNYVYCEDNYMIMMRGDRYKLVYYIGQENGEFYDTLEDPGELKNLWRDPAVEPIRQGMKGELLEWLATSTYWNSGYKCGEPGQYKRRHPAPDNPWLHGNTASPKPDRPF